MTQALTLDQRKCINIYTDSWYAFATVHIHRAIYKERGLLTAAGKTIKYKEEILHLLAAIELLKEVAVLYCRGHQTGNDLVT
jgi:ribonuclease HI